MAEIVLRILGASIGALIDGLIGWLFESTGRKVLSYWGVKSNRFAEALIGVIIWAPVFILLVALFFAFFAR